MCVPACLPTCLQICLLPNIRVMMAATETGHLRTYKYPLTGESRSNLLRCIFSFFFKVHSLYLLTGGMVPS